MSAAAQIESPIRDEGCRRPIPNGADAISEALSRDDPDPRWGLSILASNEIQRPVEPPLGDPTGNDTGGLAGQIDEAVDRRPINDHDGSGPCVVPGADRKERAAMCGRHLGINGQIPAAVPSPPLDLRGIDQVYLDLDPEPPADRLRHVKVEAFVAYPLDQDLWTAGRHRDPDPPCGPYLGEQIGPAGAGIGRRPGPEDHEAHEDGGGDDRGRDQAHDAAPSR